MPSLKLSKILNRDHHRPTLRERAAALRETVARIKKPKVPAFAAREENASTASAPSRVAQPAQAGRVAERDETALALIDATEREWAFYAEMSDQMRGDVGPGADERWEPYAQRRDAILEAAAAVSPFTREGRHAKALALAWVEFVASWHRGKTRDEYGIADGYAIDIEAGIRALGHTSLAEHVAHVCQADRIGKLVEAATAEILRVDHITEIEADEDHLRQLEREGKIAQRTLDGLRADISRVRATSASGAFAQIVVAYDRLGAMMGGRTQRQRRDAAEDAERCLLSAASVLCRLGGFDREGYGADAMMPGALDRTEA